MGCHSFWWKRKCEYYFPKVLVSEPTTPILCELIVTFCRPIGLWLHCERSMSHQPQTGCVFLLSLTNTSHPLSLASVMGIPQWTQRLILLLRISSRLIMPPRFILAIIGFGLIQIPQGTPRSAPQGRFCHDRKTRLNCLRPLQIH